MKNTLLALIVVTPCAACQFDRPNDIVIHDKVAYVTNLGSGDITVVDTADHRLTEVRIGRGLSTIALLPASAGDIRNALAIDHAANEALMLELDGRRVDIVDRLKIPAADRAAISKQHALAVVTSRWSDVVTVIDLRQKFAIRHEVKVGFLPGELVCINDTTFLLADRFGGSLALLDASTGKVTSEAAIRGHNIRGVLPDGDDVLIAHQILSEISRTEFGDVHWGTLMQNVVSRVSMSQLKQGDPVPTTIAVGDVENGAADPGGMIRLPDNRIAVTLSGVDEVLVSTLPDRRGRFQFATGRRVQVGIRPTRVATTDTGTLLVVNSLGDSLSFVDPAGDVQTIENHNKQPEPTAVQRGERAFFSAKLSHDGWLSCHSCHSQGHTPGLLADTLGDNAFDNPKLIPSLLGVGETAPFGWSANFDKLEPQAAKSILTTLHGEPNKQAAADITAYLRTLTPPSPIAESGSLADRGRDTFIKQDCVGCHNPGTAMTSAKLYDVGFRDETGQQQFNPPSLRAIRFRHRFFHDGRARSLEQAIRLHAKGLGKSIGRDDILAIRAYLLSL